MDRASGSGVFARDPDVLLDLIELELTEAVIKQEINKAVCALCIAALEKDSKAYLDDWVSQDDICSSKAMLDHCRKAFPSERFERLKFQVIETESSVKTKTAWRIEGTLREFPKFAPVNLWFDYPIHHVDKAGGLKEIEPEGERPPWQKALEKRKDPAIKAKERRVALENAFEACSGDGEITTDALSEYLGISIRTLWNRIKEHGDFETEKQGDGNPAIIRRKKDVSRAKNAK
jgi:RecA-family ATPase